ncbi:MAG: DUF4476 domain-containing protein [Bacteroidota bacterium]
MHQRHLLLIAVLFLGFSRQGWAQERSRVSEQELQEQVQMWRGPSRATTTPGTSQTPTRSGRSRPYQRLNQALQYVATYALSVDQLIMIAESFPSEEARFEILRTGYGGVVDPENWFFVYDVFSRLSLAMLLYDYVLHHEVVFVDVPGHGTGGEYVGLPDYSGYTFPSYQNYSGPVGNTCTLPISESDFRYLLERIDRNVDDDQLLGQISQILQTQCLATAHVMKLALLLPLELDRLQFLKYGLDRVFDIGQYAASEQVLDHAYYRDDLLGYIHQYGSGNQGGVGVPCEVSREYFGQIRQDVLNQSFRDRVLSKAKQYVQNECLSMEQLRTLVTLMSFDSDKLDLMKFMYPYMADPRRAHTFGSLLTYSSSQRDWDEFLAGK